MSDDRSTRNMFAAFFLIAALFVAMNRVVTSATLMDWWLPLALLIIGAALALVPKFEWFRARPEPEAEPYSPEALPPALSASGVQTYIVSPQPVARLHTMTIRPDPDTVEYLVEVEDDLTRLKGVGAKSAAALKAAGIDTFSKLAASSDDDLRAALTHANVRLVGNVNSWAEQAAFAARGDWDGLRAFNAGG